MLTARQEEVVEGIADLERRLATARARLEKVTAELDEASGIRDRAEAREARAAEALDDCTKRLEPQAPSADAADACPGVSPLTRTARAGRRRLACHFGFLPSRLAASSAASSGTSSYFFE